MFKNRVNFIAAAFCTALALFLGPELMVAIRAMRSLYHSFHP
jgi:hypothetical protein